MEYAANPHRTALHSENLPDGNLTERQRAIADAVRHCHGLADFTAAEKCRVTTVAVASVPLGVTREVANKIVTDGFARARVELDRLEAVYRAYGAEAFSPGSEGVPAREIAGETRHGIVVNAMRWASQHGTVLVAAGDTALRLNQSGGYEIDAAPQPDSAAGPELAS